MDFAEKRVLVTGSTRGVGRVCAAAFLEQGARVAVNGRQSDDVARTIKALGGNNLVAAPGDVSSAEACRRLVTKASEGLGGLDILVNNAGVYASGAIQTVDEATYDWLMAVNVKGVFFCTQAALPMLKASKGCVVNVSSESGLLGYYETALYCASKGAVSNMTRAMASDLAPDVRVNAVCPGAINTAMLTDGLSDPEEIEALVASASAFAPMKRISEPEEIADAICYLANPRSRFVTGSMLVVDGGATACR